MLDYEKSNISKNKIRFALIDMVSVLEEGGENNELFTYQEPLAPLPPSAEYNLELSVSDKGKTLSLAEPHILKGGEGDRIILCIKAKESLFAHLEFSVKTDDEEIIPYPKPLACNLLRYKQNGREEITPNNRINESKYRFDGKMLEQIGSRE